MQAWAGVRAMAGLSPDVTPHVLKHACATLLQGSVTPWDGHPADFAGGRGGSWVRLRPRLRALRALTPANYFAGGQ